MKIFKVLGSLLGIKGKPVSWLPGVLIDASQSPTAFKETVEQTLKAAVAPQIEAARGLALANLKTLDPEAAINNAFDLLQAKLYRLQL